MKRNSVYIPFMNILKLPPRLRRHSAERLFWIDSSGSRFVVMRFLTYVPLDLILFTQITFMKLYAIKTSIKIESAAKFMI